MYARNNLAYIFRQSGAPENRARASSEGAYGHYCSNFHPDIRAAAALGADVAFGEEAESGEF
jgi:hypothetical protein